MAEDEKITGRAKTSGARQRLDAVRTWLERLLLWRVWERMLEIEFVDRSVALAGKAFVSFFPLVIVVAAFVPEGIRSSIVTTVTARLGVQGDALALFRRASRRRMTFGRPPACSGSCSRSSSRPRSPRRCNACISARGGDRSHAGPGAYGRGTVWLLATLACMAVLGALRSALRRWSGIRSVRNRGDRGDLGAVVVHLVVPPAGRGAPAGARADRGDHQYRAGCVRMVRPCLDAQGSEEQRVPVRRLRSRPGIGDLVLRCGDLHPDRCVRRDRCSRRTPVPWAGSSVATSPGR